MTPADHWPLVTHSYILLSAFQCFIRRKNEMLLLIFLLKQNARTHRERNGSIVQRFVLAHNGTFPKVWLHQIKKFNQYRISSVKIESNFWYKYVFTLRSLWNDPKKKNRIKFDWLFEVIPRSSWIDWALCTDGHAQQALPSKNERIRKKKQRNMKWRIDGCKRREMNEQNDDYHSKDEMAFGCDIIVMGHSHTWMHTHYVCTGAVRYLKQFWRRRRWWRRQHRRRRQQRVEITVIFCLCEGIQMVIV